MRISALLRSSAAVIGALSLAALAPAALHAQRAVPATSLGATVEAPALPLALPGELAPVPTPAADAGVATDRSVARDAARRSTAAAVMPPDDEKHLVGPNLAMMIVGGAGIIVGSAIGGSGGTAVAVGGAVVGLVGLYRWLR